MDLIKKNLIIQNYLIENKKIRKYINILAAKDFNNIEDFEINSENLSGIIDNFPEDLPLEFDILCKKIDCNIGECFDDKLINEYLIEHEIFNKNIINIFENNNNYTLNTNYTEKYPLLNSENYYKINSIYPNGFPYIKNETYKTIILNELLLMGVTKENLIPIYNDIINNDNKNNYTPLQKTINKILSKGSLEEISQFIDISLLSPNIIFLIKNPNTDIFLLKTYNISLENNIETIAICNNNNYNDFKPIWEFLNKYTKTNEYKSIPFPTNFCELRIISLIHATKYINGKIISHEKNKLIIKNNDDLLVTEKPTKFDQKYNDFINLLNNKMELIDLEMVSKFNSFDNNDYNYIKQSLYLSSDPLYICLMSLILQNKFAFKTNNIPILLWDSLKKSSLLPNKNPPKLLLCSVTKNFYRKEIKDAILYMLQNINNLIQLEELINIITINKQVLKSLIKNENSIYMFLILSLNLKSELNRYEKYMILKNINNITNLSVQQKKIKYNDYIKDIIYILLNHIPNTKPLTDFPHINIKPENYHIILKRTC